jgi:UDP-hydrolysing UDP-N-acetyl-D-glucosamine 2-epimerase
MKKVLYLTGTRADYGPMRSTLKAIKEHTGLKLSLLVTGMHLSEEFGWTVKEIKKDRFKIDAMVPIWNKKDSAESMAQALGAQIIEFTKVFQKIKPDIVLIEGDRGEMLAGAVVARYLRIPVAHISGGDITSEATIDNSIRKAITKLAHIHFPGTKKSAKRIREMGEELWRIHMVGDPGTDTILSTPFFKSSWIGKKFNLNLKNPVLLILQHAVCAEVLPPEGQIRETMEAVKKMGYQTIVIYPNVDVGGRKIIKTLEGYKRYPFIKMYENLPHDDFINLMRRASCMIGNSSSGIIEAPLLKLPVVNIGSRQTGRERGDNIIDVDYNRGQIEKAVKRTLLDKKFKARIRKSKNPYFSRDTGKKVADILSKIKIDKKLLEKNDLG